MSDTSSLDSCPDAVVSDSSLNGDSLGDCALIASESLNGIKGGICQKTFLRSADKANFVCQKQKEVVFIPVSTTERIPSSKSVNYISRI